MSQITNSILMIKPTGFTYNVETAENNHFQNPISTQNQKDISCNYDLDFLYLMCSPLEQHKPWDVQGITWKIWLSPI